MNNYLNYLLRLIISLHHIIHYGQPQKEEKIEEFWRKEMIIGREGG